MAGEHPNGVWIWRLLDLRSDYMEKLVSCGVGRVYLKVFDGRSDPMFWGHQCTPVIVQQFKENNIQVFGWGFHYGTADVNEQVASVRQAMDCGIDGYVLDLEGHLKNPETHPHLEALLHALRPIVPQGALGYSSYAHPGWHSGFPWRIVDDLCDIALPQIYFEAFSFDPSNEQEVQTCLRAQQAAGLTKPMLPIWASEPGAPRPASVSELQAYLRRFSGSSIWRLPHAHDVGGHGWDLDYRGGPVIPHSPDDMVELPTLTRMLQRGDQGDDVKALQRLLNQLGFNSGPDDGDFGPVTERAVKAYQRWAGIAADGVVGPQTWEALGGDFEITIPEETGVRLRLAALAQVEAAKQLRWTDLECEAEKYLAPWRAVLGAPTGYFHWCAVFVAWCCREAGIEIPEKPEGFWATMAFVDSWRVWGQSNGYWFKKGTDTPQRGDLLIFDWERGTDSTDAYPLDHIGIVSSYEPGSNVILTYEGNWSNQTRAGTRYMADVAGFVSIATLNE